MTNDESEKAANAVSSYLENLEQIVAPDQVLSKTSTRNLFATIFHHTLVALILR